jgi:hypothetical protein
MGGVSSSRTDLRSASRTTGTSSPCSVTTRDADVAVVLQHHRLAVVVEAGVEAWHRAQRCGGGLQHQHRQREPAAGLRHLFGMPSALAGPLRGAVARMCLAGHWTCQ